MNTSKLIEAVEAKLENPNNIFSKDIESRVLKFNEKLSLLSKGQEQIAQFFKMVNFTEFLPTKLDNHLHEDMMENPIFDLILNLFKPKEKDYINDKNLYLFLSLGLGELYFEITKKHQLYNIVCYEWKKLLSDLNLQPVLPHSRIIALEKSFESLSSKMKYGSYKHNLFNGGEVDLSLLNRYIPLGWECKDLNTITLNIDNSDKEVDVKIFLTKQSELLDLLLEDLPDFTIENINKMLNLQPLTVKEQFTSHLKEIARHIGAEKFHNENSIKFDGIKEQGWRNNTFYYYSNELGGRNGFLNTLLNTFNFLTNNSSIQDERFEFEEDKMNTFHLFSVFGEVKQNKNNLLTLKLNKEIPIKNEDGEREFVSKSVFIDTLNHFAFN